MSGDHRLLRPFVRKYVHPEGDNVGKIHASHADAGVMLLHLPMGERRVDSKWPDAMIQKKLGSGGMIFMPRPTAHSCRGQSCLP